MLRADREPEGIVIGRLDGAGNLILEVDPTTLPPPFSRILSRPGKYVCTWRETVPRSK